MKVFVSWSGLASRALATALADWLPLVIQQVEPFMSPDIEKGERWRQVLGRELEGNEGVVCVTRSNQASAWLNFEAGALAKSQDASRTRTLLLDLIPSEVVGPLAEFQHTTASSSQDMFRFIESLNDRCPDPLKPDILVRAFNNSWSEFESAIARIDAVALDGETQPSRTTNDMLAEVLDRVRLLESAVVDLPRAVVVRTGLSTAAADRLRYQAASGPEYIEVRPNDLADGLLTYLDKAGHNIVSVGMNKDDSQIIVTVPDDTSDDQMDRISMLVSQALSGSRTRALILTVSDGRQLTLQNIP